MVCYALSRCRICSRKHKLPLYGSQESQHVFIEKIHLQLIVLNTVCMDCIGKLERLVKDSDFTAMSKTSAFQEESKEEYRAHAINETSEKYMESVSVFPKMHFYKESEEKTADMESSFSHVHNNTVEKENNSVDDEKLMVGRKQRRCIIANSLETSLPDTKENGTKKRRLARVKEIRTCKMCCDYCEKEFTHRGDLKRHKRKHTGERPYECTECDKKFSQLSNLSRHRFVHSGERPFMCQQCGQSYTRKGRLTHHIKRDLCKRKVRKSAARS